MTKTETPSYLTPTAWASLSGVTLEVTAQLISRGLLHTVEMMGTQMVPVSLGGSTQPQPDPVQAAPAPAPAQHVPVTAQTQVIPTRPPTLAQATSDIERVMAGFIPLAEWARNNGLSYHDAYRATGRTHGFSGQPIETVIVRGGKRSTVYVRAGERVPAEMAGRVNAAKAQGPSQIRVKPQVTKHIPLSEWAARNRISITHAYRLVVDEMIPATKAGSRYLVQENQPVPSQKN